MFNVCGKTGTGGGPGMLKGKSVRNLEMFYLNLSPGDG